MRGNCWAATPWSAATGRHRRSCGQAAALGLRVGTSTGFPSMGRAPEELGGATRLVAVKAVSETYPLRGQLQLRSAAGGPVSTVAAAPEPGTVWVDTALLDALQLELGDPLLLGDAELEIARIIVVEPDRGGGFASFAPRVMLAQADLEDTGLVQPASRVNYRLAVAAPDDWSAGRANAAVRAFVDYAEERIKSVPLRGVRVESLQSGRPEMQLTLDRAEKFLNLVALLAALLAAVAVGIAAREFRVAPPRRLRHAARAGHVAAAHRRRLHAGIRARRPAGQRGRGADRPGGALRLSSGCWPAWWTQRCPHPGRGRRCSASVSA